MFSNRPKLVVHHLNDSRSHRVLWLLEELGLGYRVVHHERDAQTRLAPPALKALHPLGKAPVLEDGERVIHESGAILDYLVRRRGRGRLSPPPTSDAYDRYQQWMHYAEGSAMTPLMLRLYVGRLGEAGAPLHPRIESELATHLGYVDAALAAGGPWLLGADFSAADVQMSFVGEAAAEAGLLDPFPALAAWVARLQARPAYRRALDAGGPYRFGPKAG